MIREGIEEALRLIARFDPAVIDAAIRSLWVSLAAVLGASIVGIGVGVFLARHSFPGRNFLVLLFRAGMAVPTVLIGLLCYAVLSRRGLFGELELLYTSWAIVIGEFFLAVPIVTTWTHGAIVRLDRRVFETALTLGAGPMRRTQTYLGEIRLALVLAMLTAFARCFTELGIAMMVGGNLPDRTRTLTTATALQTSQGEFARGIAMSLILLLVALLLTFLTAWFGASEREEAQS